MKLLFADIDGVFVTRNDQTLRTRTGVETDDEYGQLFDPNCVNQLKRVIDATGAKIVISSTWRTDGLATMKFMWHDRGLSGEVIGVTPIDRTSPAHAIRGSEIFQFIKTAPEWLKVDSYAIVDDEAWHFTPDQIERFVRTTWNDGLTKEKADKLIEILNKTL